MYKEIYNKKPLEKANHINKFFFWWLKDIIRQGEKRDLESSDIYDPMPEDLSGPLRHTLEMAWESEMNHAKTKSEKPSLSRTIMKTYCLAFLKFASLQALYVTTLMIQPQIMERIMLYFDRGFDSTLGMPTLNAYAYATMSTVLMALQIAFLRHGFFHLNRLGMQIKIAVSSLIFKKITKLPYLSVSCDKSASAVNLLSNDVARFEVLSFLAFMGIIPLQIIGVTYLVYSYVGLVASVAGVVLMILQTIPLQVLYYKLALKWRAKQTTNTDKRISLIEEILTGVRMIKMYAWENYFQELAFRARSLEIKGFLKISYLMTAVDSLLMISHRVCSLVVTLVYFLQCRIVTTANMLTVRQHFYNLRGNLSIYLFLSVQAITNLCVSIRRIENFLSLDEVTSSVKKLKDIDSLGLILITNVTAFWDETTDKTTLYNVNIDFLPKKLYTILGRTGSGKSSLLQLILGELEPYCGEISVAGEVSYASQEPWLFNASIRENILLGETYVMERYDKVVSACALVDDFNNMPHGDQTLVSDRGMSLSGGQRVRINLARYVVLRKVPLGHPVLPFTLPWIGRAVYRQADIYLLDDPFSAVDTRVAKILRTRCIDGLLKDKTIILVTSNVHYLGKDDQVILLNSGKIQYKGKVLDFRKNNDYVQLLPLKDIDPAEAIENLDEHTVNEKSNKFDIFKGKKTAVPNINEEAVTKGALSKSVFLKYAKAGGYAGLVIVLAAYTLPTVLLFKFDFALTAWTEEESHNSLKNQTVEHENHFNKRSLDLLFDGIKNTTIVTSSVYILGLIVITTILKDVFTFRFVYNASRELHNNMFARLIRTPMHFFELNPAGRILNRFSEDVGSLDNALPDSLINLLKAAFHVVGSLIFVLIMNWWNVVPILCTTLLFLRMSYVYVAGVPKIKRLVGTAKSPVLNFITSTLAGLTTIRSCHAENFVVKEFDCRLDQHTAAYFLVLASSTAFALWVETLAVGLFAITAYSCIALKDNGIVGGEVGLILTTIYEIVSSVSYMVRVFADTCAYMINVERIVQYTDLEPENFAGKELTEHTLESWPSSGEIKFQRVNLRYSDEDKPVLKDLSFTIRAGAKVGIVGRTGAGKSSLITALFRLAKMEGQIFIDNVHTQKLDLSHLRSKISIIPQEPILFSASLRSNLDPLHDFEDVALWSVLDSVGLKSTFSSLDQPIEKAGKNLSLGQRQLLCLARVAVKNNKILVLDEATANVDSATDAQIQNVIRDKFKSCTILTIAHRLNTIMDSDKVLVMDNGQVVEYDHPRVLLQNSDGKFSKMVKLSGETITQQMATVTENTNLVEKSSEEMSQQLRTIAENVRKLK